MPYVFLFSVANFVARLQNYVKLDKSSISLQTQYWLWFMFRGWSLSSMGTSGSRRRCSRTSRTTWRWTPTSRARIPGSGLNSGLWQNNNGKHILCVCSNLFDLCPTLYIQLAMSYMNWKFWWTFIFPEFKTSLFCNRYSLDEDWIIILSGTRCPTDGRWRGRRTTSSGARESTRCVKNIIQRIKRSSQCQWLGLRPVTRLEF